MASPNTYTSPGGTVWRLDDTGKRLQYLKLGTQEWAYPQSNTGTENYDLIVAKLQQLNTNLNQGDIPFVSLSKLTPAQKKWWYQNRYSADEIRLMQQALNNTGLYNIPVTGIPDEALFEAAEKYQKMFALSTGVNMKFDGLIGDETNASLGLAFNSANRGYTISGRNLGRTATSAQNLKMSTYANGSDVLSFILGNHNGIYNEGPHAGKSVKEVQKEYVKKYYKYLSPENKRRVYNRWDGENGELGLENPEDVELSLHLQNVDEIKKAYNKLQVGLGNMVSRLGYNLFGHNDASVDANVQKYAALYKLSPEQVKQIMTSEEWGRATDEGRAKLLQAQQSAQNQKERDDQEMENYIREGRDKFAGHLVNTVVNYPYMPYLLLSAAISGNKEDAFNNLGKSFSQMYGMESEPVKNADGSINWSGVKNAGINLGLDIASNPFVIGNAILNLPKMGLNFLTQGRNLRIYTPGSQLPHGTYKMGNNVFSPTNLHYDAKVPVNGKLILPRTPNGKFTPLAATGKNSPNSGLGFTGTIGDEVAYRTKVAATTKTPMNQWLLGNTPMSKINSGKEIPFTKLTDDMLGTGIGNAVTSNAVTPYGTTDATGGDAAAFYISEINNMKANDPSNPLITLYEAILKLMGVPSNKKGGCMYKKGKRVK